MGRFLDSTWGMICAGFLSPVDRADLTALARDGSAAHRLARRANALVLLDSGWNRSGLIALLHRLGLEYHKPKVIPRKLDEEKQKAFIANYEKVLNSLPDDEAVLFADAVHPTHAARPAGCWAPSQENLAIEQT